MVTSNPLQLINTPQVFPVPGGISGSAQLLIQFETAPTAGTVTVERRAPGVAAWSPLAKGTAKSITSGALSLRIDGVVGSLRVTFTGLTGGAAPILWVDTNPTPQGLFNGLAAVTTQPYTEANVKNGVQFNLRAVWPLGDVIAPAGIKKIWFKTAAKQVIVKLREVQYVAEELKLELFKTPTGVTLGTDLAVHNYNGVSPVATTVLAKKNVTTTTNGTAFDNADPEYFFGSANAPQRAAASIPQGRERILPANSEFLIVITNTGTGDARVQYFLDWYEGDSDIPL
jgi:hypothetical protein